MIINARIAGTYTGFLNGRRCLVLSFQYGLDQYKSGLRLEGDHLLGEAVWSILDALEVETWESLKGRPVRVRIEGNQPVAVGHLLNETWFETTQLENGELE